MTKGPTITVLTALSELESATSGYRDRRALAIENALKAGVRSALPGWQQKGNLDPLMEAARTAFLRSLRSATRREKNGGGA